MIHTAEKLPIPFEVRMKNVEERLAGKAFQQIMQRAGGEHHQRHLPVMVGPCLGDADQVANRRMAAIGPHQPAPAQAAPPRAAMFLDDKVDARVVL